MGAYPGSQMPGGYPGGYPGGTGDGGDGTANPGSAEAEAKAKKARVNRTEFIIVFVWKEPTPSDELRTIQEEVSTGSTGGMGGSMSLPGGRGGGN
jgi:hypothetical protein